MTDHLLLLRSQGAGKSSSGMDEHARGGGATTNNGTTAPSYAEARPSFAGDATILIRSGAADASVPPFYSRRMAREFFAAGADEAALELSIVPDKEHWWWDTHKPNDGGAVWDAQIRTFVQRALKQQQGGGWQRQQQQQRQRQATTSTRQQ